MLVNIVAELTLSEIFDKVVKIENDSTVANYIDIYELRLDYIRFFDESMIAQLAKIKSEITKPVIFTLRSKLDNGKYEDSEEQRLLLISKLASSHPDYLDLEHHVDNDYISKIKKNYPGVKIIRSYHNFEQSTADLNLPFILASMQHLDCSIYKLCTYANSSLDCLVGLDFLKCNNIYNNIATHSMGVFGAPSRILGKIYNNYFTYAYYDNDFNSKDVAPGLLSVQELLSVYNYKSIDNKTKIYALLGHPVLHSIGHLYHNENFKKNNINAVYVKFDIPAEQFDNFIDKLACLEYLNFAGFSITMPHKNAIVRFLDINHDNKLDAVNTVLVNNGKLYGINTDGQGCVRAIELNSGIFISNKQVLVLGSGGSASAIISKIAESRGICTIVNRTLAKANLIAEKYNFDFFSLNDFLTLPVIEKKIDVIINTLPSSVTIGNNVLLEVLKKLTHKEILFMDINYNNFIFIEGAKNISGIEMFKQQADLQFSFWVSSDN